MMSPENGLHVSLWEVAAGALWVIAATLMIVDMFVADNQGFGRLGEAGVYLLVVAAVVTTRCIAQRHLAVMTGRLRDVYEMGRDRERVRQIR